MTEIIDAWMQLPNKPYLLDPMFGSLRRWPTAWKALAGETPDIPHDEALQIFLTQGVSRVVASAWWGPAGPLITNEGVAAAVRKHPACVVGVASVDITRPMAAVRELRRCVKEYGFKGLRVLPWLWVCRRTTAGTTRSMLNALSWTSPSASKWDTQGQSDRRSPDVPFPTWTMWPMNSLTCGSSAAIRLPVGLGDDLAHDEAPQCVRGHVGLQGFALSCRTGGLRARPGQAQGPVLARTSPCSRLLNACQALRVQLGDEVLPLFLVGNARRAFKLEG